MTKLLFFTSLILATTSAIHAFVITPYTSKLHPISSNPFDESSTNSNSNLENRIEHRSPLPNLHMNHLRTDPTSQLLQIMPSASSCSGSPFPNECATASTAVSPLIASFQKYSVLTGPEQAALLSLIAYESGELKYNQNHFPSPGTPGQGTRNMMSPTFVQQYASSFSELQNQISGKSPAQVLALVQPDQYSFGSAAWFYSTKCSDEIKNGVKYNGKSGWENYITQCVGTTVDDGRVGYWTKACQALSVPV